MAAATVQAAAAHSFISSRPATSAASCPAFSSDSIAAHRHAHDSAHIACDSAAVDAAVGWHSGSARATVRARTLSASAAPRAELPLEPLAHTRQPLGERAAEPAPAAARPHAAVERAADAPSDAAGERAGAPSPAAVMSAWQCVRAGHDSLRTFTWAEVERANTREHCLLVIHRHVYDVTAYLDSHPGGEHRLLGAAGGKEVTWLFESSHPRFVRDNLLEKFVVGHIESEERDPAIRFNDTSPFYETLKERVEAHLKARRVRANRCAESYFRIVSILVLSVWLYVCAHVLTTSVLAGVLCSVLNGLVYTQLFLLGHESTHGSLCRWPWANRVLSFSWDVMSHAHQVEWQLHSMAHHLYVGAGGYDPDDDWIPFGLLRTRGYEQWRWFHQYQHIYCWPLYGFFSFVRYCNQFAIPFSGCFRRWKLAPMTRAEMAKYYTSKLLFAAYMFALPMLFEPWWRALLLSGTVMYVNGWLLCCFTYYPHTVKLDDERMTKGEIVDESDSDWAIYQVKNSVSYGRRDDFVIWFMTGWENFHAEHHLFPYLNPVWCRMVSPIVRDTCKEFNVPYMHCGSFSEFFAGQYRFWKEMGRAPKAE